jgi:hypothetical protein
MKVFAEDNTNDIISSVRYPILTTTQFLPKSEYPKNSWFKGSLVIKHTIPKVKIYTGLLRNAKKIITIKENAEQLTTLKLVNIEYITDHVFLPTVGYICPNGAMSICNEPSKSKCCVHLYQSYPGTDNPSNFFRNDGRNSIKCNDCARTWHCWKCKDASTCSHPIELHGQYTEDDSDIEDKDRSREVECTICNCLWESLKVHRGSGCPHNVGPDTTEVESLVNSGSCNGSVSGSSSGSSSDES